MRTRIHCTLFALALAASLGSAQAAGTVLTSWPGSADFTDAGHSGADRERTLQALGAHMQALGARLPDGQVLRVEVLDLDLAGETRPSRGWGLDDARVLRGMADWPRMTLRYTLQAAGQTLSSGEARLSDMTYLFRPREGALAYEKNMLEQWFQRSFAVAADAR